MTIASIVSHQSRAIVVVVVVACLAGIYGATQLPVAIFPQTNFPRIVIIMDDGVVPAQQMLVTVTRPIEEAMNGIPGIARIRSRTERGASSIDLFFDWKTDIDQALTLVQGRMSQLATGLPSTASIRRLEKLTFAVFPVAGYSLTSDSRDPASLRDLAFYTIKPRLARLPGVAMVTVAGGKTREFHVTLDPTRLSARNVTIQQVLDGVKNQNVIDSPGLIEENHRLELALVVGQAVNSDDLSKIVVATVNSSPVLLRDIASVGVGTEPQYIIVTADGHAATLLNVIRQPGANTVQVVDEVKAELESMKSQLPPDVKVAPFYDQSLLVRGSIDSVRDSIFIGLLLSAVIIFAFLRSWGATLVALLVIPITVLVTFLVMWVVNLSFDLMTLGGVAAAIGLVIDDAIVVVEAITRHLRRGQSRRGAVQTAMMEIAAPVVGSTLTPVVVFLPLSLLSGVTGVFFRSLALTMAAALLTSLVLALTLTPVLAERLIRTTRHTQIEEGEFEWDHEGDEKPSGLLGWIIGRYEWVLDRALRHPVAVFSLVGLVLLGSVLLYRGLGSEFLPEFDESAFVLDYKAPPGTSLAETDRMLKHVESMLAESDREIESYSRRTGLELGLQITEPNTGDFLVKLKARHKHSTEEVTDDLRKDIEKAEPALHVEFAGILSDLIGDLISSPAPIEIKLFSEDAATLDKKAYEVQRLIKDIPGIVDTFSGVIVSGPAVTFRVDPQRAGQLGVTASDVSNALQTAMVGNPASSILQQGHLVTVRVNMPPAAKESLDTLRALQIRSSTGALFRVDQVADIEYDKGQTEIMRDSLRRSVAVTGRLNGITLGGAIKAIKAKLGKDLILPPGMTVEYGGLFEEQQNSFQELSAALGLAIGLVFIVLLIEFRSFRHPVAIVAGAVLAIAGVLLALFLTRTTLNVVSYMGMIMVVGIVAKNGILMLDSVDDHLAEGDSMHEALLASGRRRFRPVLMTSLAAILGLAPLAFAIGSGAAILQPLAIGVIGGLATALILSLVVTPVVYKVLKREN